MTNRFPFRCKLNLRPWVLGHRGARRVAPENTLLAFERALEAGADGVELDVRLNRDGEVVVFHDQDLSRLTEGNDRRPIAKISTSELHRIDLGEGAHIPTLTEVLTWAKSRGALLNIELKSDGEALQHLTRATVENCRAHYPSLAPTLLFSSFHLGMLEGLRILGAPGKLALLWGENARFLPPTSLARTLGLHGVHPESKALFSANLALYRKHGLFVGTWTVNHEAEILRVSRLGADVIITDDPALARRTLAQSTDTSP